MSRPGEDDETSIVREPREGLRLLAQLIAAEIRRGAEPEVREDSVVTVTRGRPRAVITAVSAVHVRKAA